MKRRTFLKLAAFSTAGLATATYGFVIEPGFMLNTVAYALTPPKWTPGLKLRAAVIADPHVSDPWFPLSRWQKIIDTVLALEPEIIFMLGDYVSGMKIQTGNISPRDIAQIAGKLRAPLGVYSINGNHDWRADKQAQESLSGPPLMQREMEDAGITVLANKAVSMQKDGMPFWISGTDSIVAFRRKNHEHGRAGYIGVHDFPGTMAQITDNSPIIHLAHEPDLFAEMDDRVSLTLSGHTHGGQVRIMGRSPWIPSEFGRRYRYGHIVEHGRHLIVSGGLGCSNVPMRFAMPPEINLLELG